MEYKFDKKEVEELRDRAKDIIKNASRDIVLWDAILKDAELRLSKIKNA